MVKNLETLEVTARRGTIIAEDSITVTRKKCEAYMGALLHTRESGLVFPDAREALNTKIAELNEAMKRLDEAKDAVIKANNLIPYVNP
jgi:hypothetical protein